MTAVESPRALDALAAAFIDGTLPRAAWTHEAHLRVGLWHCWRFAPDEALALLRTRIRALNVRHGVANTETAGYHETITRVYVAVIADFLAHADPRRGIDALADELLARHADRLLPLRYYSRERLFSADARLGWVPPDLAPLPAGRSTGARAR